MPCLSEAVDDKLTLSKFYDFCRIEKETKIYSRNKSFFGCCVCAWTMFVSYENDDSTLDWVFTWVLLYTMNWLKIVIVTLTHTRLLLSCHHDSIIKEMSSPSTSAMSTYHIWLLLLMLLFMFPLFNTSFSLRIFCYLSDLITIQKRRKAALLRFKIVSVHSTDLD